MNRGTLRKIHPAGSAMAVNVSRDRAGRGAVRSAGVEWVAVMTPRSIDVVEGLLVRRWILVVLVLMEATPSFGRGGR
jgi:hypothetical protein